MEADRERWDARYRERSGRSGTSELLRTFAPEASTESGATALDIASGDGGNCEWLAQRGFAVHAVDISKVALARVRTQAQDRQLSIQTHLADLDVVHLSALPGSPPNGWDLIVAIMFFSETVLAQLPTLLAADGRLILRCFAHPPTGPLEFPSNPDFACRHEQVQAALAHLDLLHCEHLPRPRADGRTAWISEFVAQVPTSRVA